MAKAKKMENEVTVAETKEVGFSDLELTIKKPSLGKDGTMVVGGNFEELAGQIAQVVQKSRKDGVAELVIITDDVAEKNFNDAMTVFNGLSVVKEIAGVIRVY